MSEALGTQDSSAIIRARHTARSLVMVAMERLPGSLKMLCRKDSRYEQEVSVILSKTYKNLCIRNVFSSFRKDYVHARYKESKTFFINK